MADTNAHPATGNCGFPDGVMHQHMGACYRAGRRDLEAALQAVIAEPDDTQWWPVQPYMDPAIDDEVTEVQVVDVARLRALLPEGGDGRG